MKLQDLLNELRLNILNDRSDRTSGDSDYLWTDETLIRYINEAQRRFASRALVIRDSKTPEVTRVTLQEGVSEYTLHDSVLAVISAQMPGSRSDMARTGHSVLNGHRVPSDNWDISAINETNPGLPVAFSTDEAVGEMDSGAMGAINLRLYPRPAAEYAGQQLQLRVIRKPLDELTANNLTAEPELPRDHHLEMLDWAAYLALRIVDHDTGDARRAQEFAASFEEHVKEARTVVMRKLFAPKQWGFGRHGWSWEH